MVERRVTQYMARFWYAILVLLKNRPAQIPLSASSRRGRLPRFSSPDACSSVISLSRVEKIQVISAMIPARRSPVRSGCRVRMRVFKGASVLTVCFKRIRVSRNNSKTSDRLRISALIAVLDTKLLLIN